MMAAREELLTTGESESAFLAPGLGEEAAAERRWTRRQWLGVASAFLGMPAGCGLYAYGIEPHWVEFVERDLPIENLPPALEGKTLMQISDLHIGPIVNDEFLMQSFARAAARRPDLVVLTGDTVQSPVSTWEQVERVLDCFPKGPLGTLAILGNHDYGRNFGSSNFGEETVGRLRNAGLTVLRNESTDVSGLRITGLEDMLGPYWRDRVASGLIRSDRPQLVLCHNPDACDLDIWNEFRGDDEYRGWILAGHTHGGQVSVPGFGPPILPVVNKAYTSGEFAVGGGRRLYINRALGYLKRIRFGVRPEITTFTLRNAASV